MEKIFNLLLANDNAEELNLISDKLTNDESISKIDVALNGKEASEFVQNNIYDLVILDLVLQEIDGFELIEQIKNNDVSLASLGFDSEWDFPFHKQIAASVLGSWDCRLKNLCALDYSLRDAQTRVKYPMSHDEIGNYDGTRVIPKFMVPLLKLNENVYLNDIAGIFDNFRIVATSTNGSRTIVDASQLVIDLGDYKAEVGWYEITVTYGTYVMFVNVIVM